MIKLKSQKSFYSYDKIITTNKKENELVQNSFHSANGFLSFYSLKPFLKTPILKNIKVKGVLKEDGTINIFLRDEKFINIPIEIKENLKCKYGFDFILFSDMLFFKGSLMDGFDYNHLSEEISTFIVNGNMISFNKAKRTSSIGKLKRIEDVIHLNSSLMVTCENNGLTKTKKYSKSNFLGIDISMQFIQGAA